MNKTSPRFWTNCDACGKTKRVGTMCKCRARAALDANAEEIAKLIAEYGIANSAEITGIATEDAKAGDTLEVLFDFTTPICAARNDHENPNCRCALPQLEDAQGDPNEQT